jgi:outer membrane protein assembly factor BamD
MKLRLLGIAFFIILLSGCSEFQKVLKSQDYELWYTTSMELYEQKEYTRASTLLSELSNIYRGTDKAENIMYVYANCLFNMRDYMMAGHYYSEFVKTFPSSQLVEECQFQSAYCYYKYSPNIRLDQTDTKKAISEFQLFINMFPSSPKVEEATVLMDELRDKLVEKAFMNAKLYFDLGTYMGNNYQAAVITAQNTLKEFPNTIHREELSFLILESKFIQAVNSVSEKKEQRVRDTIDEYYSFANEFADSKYMKKADRILQQSEDML